MGRKMEGKDWREGQKDWGWGKGMEISDGRSFPLPRPLVPSQVFTGEDVHSPMVTGHTQQRGVLVEIYAAQKESGSLQTMLLNIRTPLKT